MAVLAERVSLEVVETHDRTYHVDKEGRKFGEKGQTSPGHRWVATTLKEDTRYALTTWKQTFWQTLASTNRLRGIVPLPECNFTATKERKGGSHQKGSQTKRISDKGQRMNRGDGGAGGREASPLTMLSTDAGEDLRGMPERERAHFSTLEYDCKRRSLATVQATIKMLAKSKIEAEKADQSEESVEGSGRGKRDMKDPEPPEERKWAWAKKRNPLQIEKRWRFGRQIHVKCWKTEMKVPR